jgi:hypothetical protein
VAARVAEHERKPALNGHADPVGICGRQVRNGPLHLLIQRDRPQLIWELARFDPRDLQPVLDEPVEVPDVSENDVDAL